MTVPGQSSLAERPSPLPRAMASQASAPWRGAAWWVLVIAVLCQSLLARGGALAAALYVACTLIYVAAAPRRAAQAAVADLVPWLYPAVALASILWSDAATTSLRLSLELCFTTGAMLAVGRRVPTRDLVSGIMTALLLAGMASLAMGARASLVSTNIPLTGIYASKNLLAFHMVLLLLCGVAALLDRTQPRLVRLLAIPSILLGLVMTRGAQSAGASVMGAMALLALLGVVLLGRIPPRLRARTLACAVIMLACLAALVATSGHELAEAFFTATGKDAGLTGRTFLWQRAGQLINERTTLGYGYQAFWRHDYPEAEALWRYFKIVDRVGFHFHDLYYEVAIELGFVGLVAIVTSLVVYGARSVRHAVLAPGPQTGLLLAVCLLLLARSGIEVDFGYPLGTVSALFPVLLTRRPPVLPSKSMAWGSPPQPAPHAPLWGGLAVGTTRWQGSGSTP